MALVFGPVPGGIAISVVLVGTLLAATTGIVGATVTTMGLISLPTMIRRGYQKELTTGIICASGTLGQIIPPSIVLVLVGDILGVSVGDLFLGAFIPGIILATLYVLYVLGMAVFRPHLVPPVPASERAAISRRELGARVIKSLIPPLVLIVAVLGSIFFGIATPTEAAAVGATGAMMLTLANGRFTRKIVTDTMDVTARLTSMVFIILVGATAFGLAFRGMGGDRVLQHYVGESGLPPNVVFGLVMLVVFVLGFFLDYIEIAFIHLPVISPVLLQMGFDPLWYGVLLGVNLQTSFLTPPFGFALFYLRGVAPPEVTTGHIYRGIMPFVILQVIGLGIVWLLPATATWLPRFVFK
jgi:tripartite ATP-independent transporter DctM subunit